MKHLIFDFDGTLVESGLLIYKNLIDYTNKNYLEWDKMRHLSSHDVVKTLGISRLDQLKLIFKIRHDFKVQLSQQTIVPDISGVIVSLKSHGYILHILSSNSRLNITSFLSQHGILDAFTTIRSSFTIFGKSRAIQSMLKTLKCPQHEAIYIGDETRDIQAAKKAMVESVAVSWGYNTEQVLTTYHPDHLARIPSDLLTILGH